MMSAPRSGALVSSSCSTSDHAPCLHMWKALEDNPSARPLLPAQQTWLALLWPRPKLCMEDLHVCVCLCLCLSLSLSFCHSNKTK